MANVTVTAVRALLVGGTQVAAGATASIPEALARELVWIGDVTCSTLTAEPTAVTPGVTINVASVADSGAMGRSLVKTADIAAVLTALGASYGAADSGGTGFKLLRVPN